MGNNSSKPQKDNHKKKLANLRDEFPDYVREAEHVIKLQELLFNLTTESLDETISILVTEYLKNNQIISVFVDNLILVAKYRPNKSEILASLFKILVQKVEQLKSKFLEQIFYPLPESPSIPIYQWCHFLLIHYCMKNGSINPDELCNQIQNLLNLYPEFVNLILFVFAYFAKEIDQNDHQLYSDLYEYYNENIKRPINPLLKDFIINLPNYQANDWFLLTKTIEELYLQDSLPYLLLHDELPELNDYNITIEASLFAQTPINNNKPTLIQFCAYFGAEKCFRELIEKNINMDRVSEYAIAGGNPTIIEILSNLNNDFSNCLETAALYHRYDLFEWLCKIHDDELMNSCYKCAISNNIKSLLSCFDNGCDIAFPDYQGNTPLHYAAKSGSYEAAHLLCGQPDVDSFTPNKDGITPLIFASQYGHEKIVSLLMKKKGVSVTEECKGKMNSLHFAAMKGYPVVVLLLLSSDKADINYPASNFATALHFACQYGHCEVVKVLFNSNRKFDINARDKLSCTPLHLAVMNGYSNIVSILLTAAKIDVNVVNSTSKTPLIIATENEYIEIVNLLLHKKGIQRNIQDRNAVLLYLFI